MRKIIFTGLRMAIRGLEDNLATDHPAATKEEENSMTRFIRLAKLRTGLRTGLMAGLLLGASGALAAEPIEGNWKTASGETAQIAKCGGAFCVTLKTGQHAGKQIGKLAGKGDDYSGEITDPANDKTYSGSGSVTGNSLRMKGCVMKILCKSQTWTRL